MNWILLIRSSFISMGRIVTKFRRILNVRVLPGMFVVSLSVRRNLFILVVVSASIIAGTVSITMLQRGVDLAVSFLALFI